MDADWTALRRLAEVAPEDLRVSFRGQLRRSELETLLRRVSERLWQATVSGDLAGERPLSPLHQESAWLGEDDLKPPPDLLWLADVLDFLVAMMGPEDFIVLGEDVDK